MPVPKGRFFYSEENAAQIWMEKKPEDDTWKNLIPVYNEIRHMIKEKDIWIVQF